MDFDSVYFQMIIDCNYQTAASIDITRLYQIGSFRINLNYHIRCLNLKVIALTMLDASRVPCMPTVSSNSSSNDSSFSSATPLRVRSFRHQFWIIPAVPVLPWTVRSSHLNYHGCYGPLRSHVFAQGITYDYLEGCLLITGSQWSSASQDVFYEIWL